MYNQNFDNRLLKILEEEAEKEKTKKKPKLHLVKEKRLQYYSGWKNKKVKQMEQEIGKIKKSDTTEVIVKVDDFGGEKGVTIREYITTERYTGFTKQGTRIPANKWKEFKVIIDKIDI